MEHDIAIDGQLGFYQISGVSEAGTEWVRERVHMADDNGVAHTDQTDCAVAIADGAVADGLTVTVNGELYSPRED